MMTRTRAGLVKVLEYRSQERRLRHITMGDAEAELSHRSGRLTAAERRLREGANGPGEDVKNGAALMAAGRYATHLRQCLERERRLMAAAVAQLMRVRERFTAAAREQAVIERLLESRRQEREYERARAERAMHDECAASAYARGLRAGRC